VVALMVDNIEMAMETLDSNGIRMISEEDLDFDNFSSFQ
jgi:hypothetical protein